MNKHLVPLSIALTGFLIFIQSAFALEVPPSISWKTLKTEHFEVIFNAKQQDLGHLYAQKLEKAYHALLPFFRSLPKTTIVVINDKTDVTNGYATRIPYPHIMAYPVLPGPEESLADSGDWAFELLAHEYTHILTFEPAGGVMKPLRMIFGNIIAPNILLPNWWKEGLAVEMETRLGHQGRLRSYYQEATIRAMVDDNSFYTYDIAEANEYIPTWPEGMRPYLFGSLMWSQMLADRGESVIATLNERHGERVPYFIETPAREALGKSYEQEYENMMSDTVTRAQNQLKTLRESSITPVTIPKNNFTSVTAPAISPDGKHLAVITEDDSNSRSVKIITREKDEQSFLDAPAADTVEKFNQELEPNVPQDGPPTGSIQRVSWFPNSQKIVYDKIDYVNRIERYSDLYTYDLMTKKTESLTKGLRGREPSVSADGSAITFVKLEGGRTHLAVLKFENNKWTEEILFSPALQERISYPLFYDDGILFSLRKENGVEQLYKYSLSLKTSDIVLGDFKNVRFARKTSEGLMFTSAANGVLNLYMADSKLKSARPITNTLTAFMTADLDPLRKEIFATHMTAQGPRVSAILEKDWKENREELPQVSALMSDRYPDRVTKNLESEAFGAKAVQEGKLEDYSPYGYLWPRYWLPFIWGSTSDSGVILRALTSGFDPLKKHSYSLGVSYDTGLNRGSFEGSYLSQATELPFAVLAYKRSSYLGTIHNPIDYYGTTLAVLPDTFGISKYSSLQLGLQYLERTDVALSIKRVGPFAVASYSNYGQSGAQISPESGGGAYLGAYNYIKYEDYIYHSQVIAGGEIYLSKWLPRHHAIMLKANGVYTPDKESHIYGVSTEPLVFVSDNPLPEYILRGYRRGQISGKNLISVNAEYRFPIASIYNGSGTDPIFMRRLSGAVIVDGVAADGRMFDELYSENISMKRSFWSTGAELKLETTVGYVIPINFVIGYYLAFNTSRGAEGVLGSTLQITGF
ncbi:hypothetical protein ACES2L_02730 [Bdellovibrio bacteriovorus]